MHERGRLRAPRRARRRSAGGACRPASRHRAGAARSSAFTRADDAPLLGPTGPTGTAVRRSATKRAEADVLDPLLRQFGARASWSATRRRATRTAVSRFDGTVIKLDAGMNRPRTRVGRRRCCSRRGQARACVTPADARAGRGPAEALYVSAATVDEDAVADILARGTVDGHRRRAARACSDSGDARRTQRPRSSSRVPRRRSASRSLPHDGARPASCRRRSPAARGRTASCRAARHWASEQDRQSRAASLQARLPDNPGSRRPSVERRPLARAAAAVGGAATCRPVPARLRVRRPDRQRGAHAETASCSTRTSGPSTLTGHDRRSAQTRAAALPQGTAAAARRRNAQAAAPLDAERLAAALGELVGRARCKALLARRDALLALPLAAAARGSLIERRLSRAARRRASRRAARLHAIDVARDHRDAQFLECLRTGAR